LKNPVRLLLQLLACIFCLAPLATLTWKAISNQLGADPTATLSFATGLAALQQLTISLAITPLRRISSLLNALAPLRRTFGLFAFFYATIHLAIYLTLYAGLDPATITDDLTKRRFIYIGVAAWLLMLPLAATSFQWAIRKLGGRNWNRLHKLVYVIAVFAIVHYWWQVKPGVLSPLPFTITVGALLLARPVIAQIKALRTRAATQYNDHN